MLDGVTSFFSRQQCKKCKLMAGFPYLMAESWKNLKDTIIFFRRLLCVRIEIDQLLSVIFLVINHSLV